PHVQRHRALAALDDMRRDLVDLHDRLAARVVASDHSSYAQCHRCPPRGSSAEDTSCMLPLPWTGVRLAIVGWSVDNISPLRRRSSPRGGRQLPDVICQTRTPSPPRRPQEPMPHLCADFFNTAAESRDWVSANTLC